VDLAGTNSGTLYGHASFGWAEVGEGFTFDGSGYGVTVPHSDRLDITAGGFSVEFWMRGAKNQPQPLATLVEKSLGYADNAGWAVQITSSNGMASIAIGSGSGFPSVTGTVDVLDGSFHHLAATWDGSTLRFYTDGQDQGSTALAAAANNGRPLNLGFAWGGGNLQGFFCGTLDEVTLYNRALTTNEIGALFAAGSGGKCASGPLPAPWLQRDIGKPPTPGLVSCVSCTNGVLAISSPSAVWRDSDQFHLVYQPLGRQGGVQARLVGQERGSEGALIIRETLGDERCREVFMDLDGSYGVQRLYWRAEPAGGYGFAPGWFGTVIPGWLRVLRAEDWFLGFVSSDGIHWTPNGAVRVSMPDQVYVGLAAASGTVAFDQASAWSGPAPGAALSLRREVWFDVPGSAVSDLTASSAFAAPPDLVDSIPSFESEGLGTNYGQRVSGYLLAPETGPYVFHLASHEAAQLWVSADANPANRVPIVEEPASGERRDWSKRSSAPITLQGGQLYYVEALHKQGTGSDYLGVAWTLPYRLAPDNGSEPIPGDQFFFQPPADAPRIVQSPSSCSVVAGVDVSLSVQAVGPALSFQWRKDDQDLHDSARLGGTRTPTLTLAQVLPGDAGRYTVVVGNLAGSVESQSALLTVGLPYGEQAVPPLQLRQEASGLDGARLSWPKAWADTSLETTDDLSKPGPWATWGVSPQQDQDQWWVWLATTNAQRFFRLRASSAPQPPVGVPPDPATIAPALPASVVTTMLEATRFLYTGSDPVQLGVTNGTIQAEQAAVVRGRVIARDGMALAGVDVRIPGHSEFGFTRSRADGRFDLAVNGGGLLTVRFQRTGYLPAQRQVNVPWQDYIQMEDVALVPLDPVVTPIDLSAATTMQVARGSTAVDQDGTRKATLFFPQGTRATMTLPDGSSQPLTTLHVRATEYTVGPNGPKAMPAELPPTVGYTYCVELGVDEADAVGGKNITFDQPIPFYVENFLGFPVGGLVPVADYDKDRAEWVPSPNGRVIKILGQTAGLADLDVAGSNVVADAASLAALGITEAERARLAGLYTTGQTLWRAPIPHLSIWDINWGWGPPLAAIFPSLFDWLLPSFQPCEECQQSRQVHQEALPIAGTSCTLNHSSDRTEGYTAANTIEIPYSHTNVPSCTKRIDLIVNVNGREFTYSFTATPNGRFKFLWDGNDAYGRKVQGCQRVTMRVGFVYDGGYQSPADLEHTFGQHSFMPEEVTVRSRQEITLWQELTSFVGGWHGQGLGLGGWSLNNHHAYDPNSRTLYYGDGRTRQTITVDQGRTINVSAGGGTNVGYGVPATQINLRDPAGLAVAPSGELYISDFTHHRIVKVDRNGLARLVAGTNTNVGAFAGDGGLAINARLNGPTFLAFGPEGGLYLNDSGNARIRRIAPSGVITTVAGGGTPADGLGDGGLASSASLIDPEGIAVGRDGRLFIADSGHNRVRVVSPAGVIETAVGGGQSLADGAAGVRSQLVQPTGVAVAPDGTLYVADSARRAYFQVGAAEICRVDPLGRVFLYSGGKGNQPPWNGLPAIGTALAGPALAVGPDGNLYCSAWFFGTLIARIRTDGLLQHVAGKLYTGGFAYGGNGGPAVGAPMESVSAIAFGPDGKMYFTEGGGNPMFGYPQVIRHVTLPMPGVTGDSIRIPSEDGAEVYVFDQTGRHLKTVDALTGAARHTFQYNLAGLLTSVTDGDGNVTTIERAADGAPMAIAGPYGQRTLLQTDANGNLSQVTDPAGNICQVACRPDGLIESLTDPRTNKFNFAYDAEGRLIHEESAGCCAGELARTAGDGASTVTATSPEGRQTTYASQTRVTGEVRRRNTFPDGTANETVTGIDASRSTTFADGTVIMEQDGGDARFGMQAPLLKSLTIRTPGGLARSVVMDQQVGLSDPADLLSLVAFTNTVVLNGRTNTTRYDAATRTFTGNTGEGRQTVAAVDAQARPLEVRVPGLEPLTLTYDARGRLSAKAQGGRVAGFGYGPSGWLQTVTNAEGRVTWLGRDDAGAVTNVVRADGARWSMDLDPVGNLLALAEPNLTNVHRFTYTAQNLLASYRSPLGAEQTYSYNRDQQLVLCLYPSGEALQWIYETNGQLARLEMPAGTNLFAYYPTNGLLARAVSADLQAQDFLYDGALLTNVAWSGLVTGAVEYAYDNDFRVAAMAYAGLRLTNQYDADGLLTNAGPVSLTRNAANGFLTRIAEGNFTIAYERNEFGEITNAVTAQGAELYRTDRSYDALGRLSRKMETIGGATVAWDYAYDAVGQLVAVRRDGVTVEGYAYDATGNRIGMTNTLTGQALTGGDYQYDADHKLLQAGATTFTYDADGRLRTQAGAGSQTSYRYNTDGTLAGVVLPGGRQITYQYDTQGRRIARFVGGVRTHAWLYGAGLMPLAEYDGGGSLRTLFVYGGRVTPVAFIRAGVTYHLATDHLGSPRLVVDAAGAVVKRVDYDAFGNIILDSAPGFDLPFGFAGGMADPDYELIRFGARDYLPGAGRWTAKDPALFDGGVARYRYCGNNPVGAVDRSGLQDTCGNSSLLDWERKGQQFLANLDDMREMAWAIPCATVQNVVQSPFGITAPTVVYVGKKPEPGLMGVSLGLATVMQPLIGRPIEVRNEPPPTGHAKWQVEASHWDVIWTHKDPKPSPPVSGQIFQPSDQQYYEMLKENQWADPGNGPQEQTGGSG
jgi:RHS repeat-associated protein